MGTDLSGMNIAPPPGEPWKPEIGEKISGKILWSGTFAQENYNKDGNELRLRIDIETDSGDKVSIYTTMNTNADDPDSGWPKRDARAVAAAVRATGAITLEDGARLTMARLGDADTKKGRAKDFTAVYEPPKPVSSSVDLSDLMGNG